MTTRIVFGTQSWPATGAGAIISDDNGSSFEYNQYVSTNLISGGNISTDGGRNYVSLGPTSSANDRCWTSSDWGISWTARTFSEVSWTDVTSKYWRFNHLFYFNSKFVYFGFSTNFRSAGYSTDNGITWTISSTALPSTTASDGWTNYAIGSSSAIIIASDQACKTTDGITWTTVSTLPSTTGTYKSITWDGTYFVVIAYESSTYKMTRSTDGVSWSAFVSLTNLPSIVGEYNNLSSNGSGTLVYYSSAVARASYSTDHGSTWTLCANDTTNALLIKYTNGYFWGLGSINSYKSANGITWSNQQFYTGNFLTPWDVASGSAPVVHKPIRALSSSTASFLKGQFHKNTIAVCVTSASKKFTNTVTKAASAISSGFSDPFGPIKVQICAAYSTVATTINKFTNKKPVLAIAVATAYSFRARPYEFIAYAGSTAWMNRSLYATRLANSITTAIKVFAISSFITKATAYGIGLKRNSKIWANLWSITYALGKFIGVKNKTTTAATSATGASWTAATLPAALNWSGIASDGTNVVAIAFGTDQAATSTNGTTWVSRTLPTSRNWKSITCMGTKFVATAVTSRHCAVSTNGGVNWTEYQLPQFANWLAVTNNGTNFVAITDSNVAAYSADGITWTQVAMPDDIHYNSVAWAAGQFTAVATGPTMLAAKSVDGVTWTGITMPSIEDWTNVGPGIGDPNA